MSGTKDILQAVKDNLKLFGGGEQEVTDGQVEHFMTCVRSNKQKILLQQPRRGLQHVLHDQLDSEIKQLLAQDARAAGVPFDQSAIPTSGPAFAALAKAEQWREIECLTVPPPTFAALKQLPELQQIVAFTAVDVTKGHPGSTLQVCAAAELQQAAQEHMQDSPSRGSARGSLDSIEQVLQLAGQTMSTHMRMLLRACVNSWWALLLRMSPQLRLVLAAEVAAGLLCPGQAPPPDTPENALTLKMFLRRASLHIREEVDKHARLAHAAATSGRSSTSTSTSTSSSSKPAKRTKVQKLWAHTWLPQQHPQPAADRSDAAGSSTTAPPAPAAAAAQASRSSAAAAAAAAATLAAPAVDAEAAAAATKAPVLLPPPGKVRAWALSPHIDLQTQVPSQMLLQQAVMAVSPDATGPRPSQQPGRHGAAAQDRTSSGVLHSATQQAPGFRCLSKVQEAVCRTEP